MLNPLRPDVINPPALVVQVKDEQTLKREWDEACDDEMDATERKEAVLREALKRWPMVQPTNPGLRARGAMIHSPEMRRFVRDVLGLPDRSDRSGGGMNGFANTLLRYGIEGTRAQIRKSNARGANARKLRAAVVELTTKYRLGADPVACMDALTDFYEGFSREQK